MCAQYNTGNGIVFQGAARYVLLLIKLSDLQNIGGGVCPYHYKLLSEKMFCVQWRKLIHSKKYVNIFCYGTIVCFLHKF